MADEVRDDEVEIEEPQGKSNDDQPAHGSAVTDPVDTQYPGGNPNNTQDGPADESDARDSRSRDDE